MRPATHGSEKAWMLVLALVLPWVACLVDGGTTADVVSCLVLWILGLWILCIPQVIAIFVVCRSNEKRKKKRSMLPPYREEETFLVDPEATSSTSTSSPSPPNQLVSSAPVSAPTLASTVPAVADHPGRIATSPSPSLPDKAAPETGPASPAEPVFRRASTFPTTVINFLRRSSTSSGRASEPIHPEPVSQPLEQTEVQPVRRGMVATQRSSVPVILEPVDEVSEGTKSSAPRSETVSSQRSSAPEDPEPAIETPQEATSAPSRRETIASQHPSIPVDPEPQPEPPAEVVDEVAQNLAKEDGAPTRDEVEEAVADKLAETTADPSPDAVEEVADAVEEKLGETAPNRKPTMPGS